MNVYLLTGYFYEIMSLARGNRVISLVVLESFELRCVDGAANSRTFLDLSLPSDLLVTILSAAVHHLTSFVHCVIYVKVGVKSRRAPLFKHVSYLHGHFSARDQRFPLSSHVPLLAGLSVSGDKQVALIHL